MLTICFSSSIAQTVTLQGKLTDLKESQVVFAYQHSGSFAVDTLKVSDGKFNWSKSGLSPGKAMLMLPGNSFVFYIEPGNISISGKIDSVIVTGSEIDAKWRAFGKSFDDLENKSVISMTNCKVRQVLKNWLS